MSGDDRVGREETPDYGRSAADFESLWRQTGHDRPRPRRDHALLEDRPAAAYDGHASATAYDGHASATGRPVHSARPLQRSRGGGERARRRPRGHDAVGPPRPWSVHTARELDAAHALLTLATGPGTEAAARVAMTVVSHVRANPYATAARPPPSGDRSPAAPASRT